VTETTAAVSDSSILFNEDFEDRIADGFAAHGSVCRVAIDENGNHVYEIDTSNSTAYAGADFNFTSQKNYSVSYRVRLVDFSATNDFPLGDMSFGNHTITLTPFHKIITLTDTKNANWSTLAWIDYTFRKNEWISILIEVKDINIKVSVNGKLVMEVNDKQLDTGSLSVSTAARTIVQFDDIQVKSLGQ
jgi:hypothetical protein